MGLVGTSAPRAAPQLGSCAPLPRGAPGGSGQPGAPRARLGHWVPATASGARASRLQKPPISAPFDRAGSDCGIPKPGIGQVSLPLPLSLPLSRYAQYSFLPQSFEIHWLSIINSFVLVLLLTGFLSIILMRVLKNDFSRYARGDEEDEDEEETGWKLVHGDVFRLPPASSVFCAFIGTLPSYHL